MVTSIILAMYILCIIIAGLKVSKWDNTVGVKFVAAVVWPLTLVLYAIHVIHNGLRK